MAMIFLFICLRLSVYCAACFVVDFLG
jgi:hypothetical protein